MKSFGRLYNIGEGVWQDPATFKGVAAVSMVGTHGVRITQALYGGPPPIWLPCPDRESAVALADLLALLKDEVEKRDRAESEERRAAVERQYLPRSVGDAGTVE